MKTILTNPFQSIWKGKAMLISVFLFAGCAQDSGLAPENPNLGTARQLSTSEDPNECSMIACSMNSEKMTNARITILNEFTNVKEFARQTTDELAGMNGVFIAHLNADNEVPANASNGQGQVSFTLNDEGTALEYRLIVANTTSITQAHIHCGEAGVNGPVVVFLFGLDPAGVNQNGILAEGTITAENIIARDSSAACMGGLNSMETLLEKMRNGGAYVNVHTLALPAGVIRGQIRPD
jgi:hypothetical protein